MTSYSFALIQIS